MLLNWQLFFQLQYNPYAEPNSDYQLSSDDFKWLASQMTDRALQRIERAKGWNDASIANAKKFVETKFNEFVNPQGGQHFNVLFNRLSQLIRSTRIDSAILKQEARKELQALTVFCAAGGRNVLNIIVDGTKVAQALDNTYNMTILQAITDFSQSGFFRNGDGNSLDNFFDAIRSFCKENGLDFEQCKQDVRLNAFVDQNFKTQCSTEIGKIDARKKDAIQWINWIAACVLTSPAVPVFLSTQGFPPVSDELGVSLEQRPYVFFARLCDFCANPFNDLRGVGPNDMDDIETAAYTTVPIVASLIVDCVYANLKIGSDSVNTGKAEIMGAFENFIKNNGDKITYSNSLDQIAELIRLHSRVLFQLPGPLNVQSVRDELLNVLIPFAANGGILKDLYQMPIEHAINMLQQAAIQYNYPLPQLQNFLAELQNYCAYRYIDFNTVSISQLSMMQ